MNFSELICIITRQSQGPIKRQIQPTFVSQPAAPVPVSKYQKSEQFMNTNVSFILICLKTSGRRGKNLQWPMASIILEKQPEKKLLARLATRTLILFHVNCYYAFVFVLKIISLIYQFLITDHV